MTGLTPFPLPPWSPGVRPAVRLPLPPAEPARGGIFCASEAANRARIRGLLGVVEVGLAAEGRDEAERHRQQLLTEQARTPAAETPTPPPGQRRYDLPHPPVSGRKVGMLALSGQLAEPAVGPVPGMPATVVVDLAGVVIDATRPMPLRYRHHAGEWAQVGWVTSVTVAAEVMTAEAFLAKGGEHADHVSDMADLGAAWQCSVGGKVTDSRWLSWGETLPVNGRLVEGPASVALRTHVHEISLVRAGEAGDPGARVNFGPPVLSEFERLVRAYSR